jgi:two-component system, OmpR family, KDP operon response regulator KdpE
MAQIRVFLLDDHEIVRRGMREMLEDAGDFEVVGEASTAAEASRRIPATRPDVAILDGRLPDGSGVDVCRDLRTWTQAPVVVLSVIGEEREKVAALDAGADDYVTKPFGVEELLARLRAALRRAGPSPEPVIHLGELEVDLEKRRVLLRGETLQLTPHEFELLRLLAQNEGKLLTHAMILREVWGPAYQTESHYLHVYVSQLRRKIEDDPARPRYLLTEPGAGYRLVDPS